MVCSAQNPLKPQRTYISGFWFPDLSLLWAKILKYGFIKRLTCLQIWFLDGKRFNIWAWFWDLHSGKTPTLLAAIFGNLCLIKTPASSSKSPSFGTPSPNATFQPSFPFSDSHQKGQSRTNPLWNCKMCFS